MGALSTARDLVIDAWSALSHKAPMRDTPTARIEGWAPATWTGEEHHRRLTAYLILSAYDSNVSREFLATTDQADRDDRREYGDAALIIDQVLAHLLGDEQEIVVPGAEVWDEDRSAELVEQRDAEPAAGDDPAAGEPVDHDAIAAELADLDHARGLADLQSFLRAWADDVHLPLRMIDAERNAVRSGDAAYLLGWDDRRNRPTCAVMDPGSYFPVLPDTLDAYEYPERVHFAWELPGEDFPDGKTRIRRITYQVRDLQPILDEVALEMATNDAEAEAAWSLPEDTRWEERDGIRYLVRQYPWDDEPSTRVCTVTDATWVLDDLNDARNVDAFTLDQASIAMTDDGELLLDFDLGIDFLPVVHIPNTPPGGEHFGQSSLARVLQLIDDLQSADTDAQKASALTGTPLVGISGAATADFNNPLTGQRGMAATVEAGAVLRLGDGGRLDALDTSNQLAELRNFVQSLRDRLAVNSRLPAAVLGTVKPSEVPSGFAMQLSFGPLTSMIRQMRLVRSVKYSLLLKMVTRLYQANGGLPPGPTPRLELALGAFLPTDQAAVLEQVKSGRSTTPPLFSLETAITMLLEAGFPIDDVAEEIARIESRDFDGADRLVDATGDTAAGREYLGLAPAPTPAPESAPLIGGDR